MAFGLLGIGSCSESLEQICEQKLPALEHSLATALPAIGSETDLNWEIWAEQKLEEIQYWIDVLEYQENYKFEKDQLDLVANELVIFHGFAAQGDRERMRNTIEKIRRVVEEAKNRLCTKIGVNS